MKSDPKELQEEIEDAEFEDEGSEDANVGTSAGTDTDEALPLGEDAGDGPIE